MYTNNFIVERMNNTFKEHKITRQQYNVLRILRGQHPQPATIGLIKERMLDKMSDASRIVDRLENKGLIRRKQNKKDRRATDIQITSSGLNLLKKMDDPIDEFEKFLSNLSSNQIKELNTLLDNLRKS